MIHVGVSNLARKITLETVAQKSGYERSDIYGQKPPCQECCIGTSPFIQSGLDLNELNNRINSTSTYVNTELSRDAGR